MFEQPEITVDHRPYHNQGKRCLQPFDFGDIPPRVKHSIHRMRGLDDNVLREFRRPPPEFVNIWVKLEYGKAVPLLFDREGIPYIMAPAKKRPAIKIKVLIKEKKAEGILEHLGVATDFCDHCEGPLHDAVSGWLSYDEGGGSVADIYNCEYCEEESIRWDKEFLEHHPEMGELKTR